MKTRDPLLFRQLKVIQKIVEDETWLEGERRGCAVSRADRIVRENVCRVVLRIGQQLREAAAAAGRAEGGSPANLVEWNGVRVRLDDIHPEAA